MNAIHLLVFLLILSSVGYVLGRKKAFSVAGGPQGLKSLHSRPVHYGALTAMWCGIPALIIYAAWLALEPSVITNLVLSGLPEEVRALPDGRINLLLNDIRNLVKGNIVSAAADPLIQQAADRYFRYQPGSGIGLRRPAGHALRADADRADPAGEKPGGADCSLSAHLLLHDCHFYHRRHRAFGTL
jgi:phosphate transport system permease protein